MNIKIVWLIFMNLNLKLNNPTSFIIHNSGQNTEIPIALWPLLTSHSKPRPLPSPDFMQCAYIYIWLLCRPFQMLQLSPLTDLAPLSTLCWNKRPQRKYSSMSYLAFPGQGLDRFLHSSLPSLSHVHLSVHSVYVVSPEGFFRHNVLYAALYLDFFLQL